MSLWWLLLIVPATAIGAIVGFVVGLRLLISIFFGGRK